jgi:hypothetical protein
MIYTLAAFRKGCCCRCCFYWEQEGDLRTRDKDGVWSKTAVRKARGVASVLKSGPCQCSIEWQLFL